MENQTVPSAFGQGFDRPTNDLKRSVLHWSLFKCNSSIFHFQFPAVSHGGKVRWETANFLPFFISHPEKEYDSNWNFKDLLNPGQQKVWASKSLIRKNRTLAERKWAHLMHLHPSNAARLMLIPWPQSTKLLVGPESYYLFSAHINTLSKKWKLVLSFQHQQTWLKSMMSVRKSRRQVRKS